MLAPETVIPDFQVVRGAPGRSDPPCFCAPVCLWLCFSATTASAARLCGDAPDSMQELVRQYTKEYYHKTVIMERQEQ